MLGVDAGACGRVGRVLQAFVRVGGRLGVTFQEKKENSSFSEGKEAKRLLCPRSLLSWGV
jgi:hypothetical protein